jgi:hypothetical protein
MLLEKECHFAEGDIHELIHKEPENDPEELPIYVFAVWADGGSQELLDEGEMLSLYFTIPNVQDMPYELVNG